MSGAALEGVKVADLSRFIAGPLCGQILGDLGAEVIKVERRGGEDSRQNPPLVDGVSLYTVALNRNKLSMTLDTRHPESRKVLERLVADSDILIENFRPGTLDRMGFSHETLLAINPRLIVTSISGFGQTGPFADRALFDAIAQAMSGLMSMTGETEPAMAGTYIADYVAAFYGVIGTLAALRHRDRTGEGQVVDIASIDGIFSCLATQATVTAALGTTPKRTGSRDPLTAPGNVFRAQDGYLYIHAGTNALFPRLCVAMGRPELAADTRYSTIEARVSHVEEVEAEVQSWLSMRDTETAGASLTAQGIPWGPVLSLPEVINSPFIQARDMIVGVENSTLGRVSVPASPLKLSRTPPQVRRSPPNAGEHTTQVLRQLGFNDSEIDELFQAEVV